MFELEADEKSKNRPWSSDMVTDFIDQSESRPSASTSSAEHLAQSETCFIYVYLISDNKFSPNH